MADLPVTVRPDQAEALSRVCRLFGERQWCLATGGNFSLRTDSSHCLITRSGRDKSRLSVDDLMICDLDGRPADASLRPSAETALHACLYRSDPAIAAVLHTHSIAATVMSRAAEGDIVFNGYEMQKAIAGVASHDAAVVLALFENSQSIPDLARELACRLQDGSLSFPGFLVRGHGLYAWGASLADAQRHLEGFEFLLACAWQERLLDP